MSIDSIAATPSSSKTYPFGGAANRPQPVTPNPKISSVAKKAYAASPRTPNNKENSPYKFRTKTKQKTDASKASYQTPKKSRKIVPIEKTASQIRGPHDCKMVDTAITKGKTFARLGHSMSLFALNYAFGCTTERRKTHANGAPSSNCGGCHVAHAALTCTFNDNILQIGLKDLKLKPLSQLEPNFQLYLTSRFKLSKAQLNSPQRVSILEKKIKSLSEAQKRSSFIGTDVALERTGVYENSISSNRFDIYLERTLRPLEDELAEKCRRGELSPTEALEQLQTAYRQLVQGAIDHLHADLNRLEELQSAWDDMLVKQQSGDFKNYLPPVDRYLKAFNTRFRDRQSGTPRLGGLKKYLVNTQSRYVLNELRQNKSEDYFDLSEHHLKIPADSNKEFTKAQRNLERWLTEAHYQLDGLHNTTSDIEKMFKYSYGEKDKDGVMQLPDKERIGKVFCSTFAPN